MVLINIITFFKHRTLLKYYSTVYIFIYTGRTLGSKYEFP